MNKPEPKSETALSNVWPDTNIIIFWATKDAIEDIKDFGSILPHNVIGQDGYWLKVDGRFDFEEVVAYIRGYGNEQA